MRSLTKLTATLLLAQVVLTACSDAVQGGSGPDPDPEPASDVVAEPVALGDENPEEDQVEPVADDVVLTDEPLAVTDAVVASDRTAIFDDVTRRTLTEFTSTGTLRFEDATPQVEALQPGDVVVSRPSDVAPEGIFRKVTTVTTSGSDGRGLVIGTEEATLDDAFDQGDFYIEIEVGSDGEATHRMVLPEEMRGADLTRELFLDWGDLEECPQPDPSLPPGNQPGNPCVGFSDDVKLKASDCGKSRKLAALTGKLPETEVADGVTIAGEAELALTVCLYASISKSTFIAVVGGEQTAKVDVKAAQGVQLEKEMKIGSAPLAKASFGALTVRGDLELVLGLKGSIEGAAELKLQQKAAAYAGAGYKNGWHDLSHADFDVDATLTLTGAKADLKAYAGAKPALTIALGEACFIKCLSVAKGSVGITGKVYAQADAVPARTPACRLHGGVEIVGFVKVRILGFIKEDLDGTLYDKKDEDIASCSGDDGQVHDPRLADIDDLPAELAQDLDPTSADQDTLGQDVLVEEPTLQHPARIDAGWLDGSALVMADRSVALDSAGEDDEHDGLAYVWTATSLTSEPGTPIVIGTTPQLDWDPADTFPKLDSPVEVEIRLTVTDVHGNVTTDAVVVTVEPAT